MMTDNDILLEILKSKEKLWSDKKRLGILTENDGQEKDTHHADVLQNSRQDEKTRLAERLSSGSPGFGRKHPHKESPKYTLTLPEDVRDKKKAELISKLLEPQPITAQQLRQVTPKHQVALPDDLRARKKAEHISRLSESGNHTNLDLEEGLVSPTSMVRFGEYSPLNPGILSPGKTLLGLGDWEEKRRQIIDRKKKEYMELMSQARQEAAQQQPLLCTTSVSSKTSVGTQTDLMITGYADVPTPPGSSGRSLVNALSSHSHLNVATSTQTSGGNLHHLPEVKLPERSSSPFLLSPRERKVAETYSPSFLINHNVLDGFSSPQEEEHLSEITRRRREAYQEELRKQIEEKRQLEAERLERERREEEAIARRAEQQRERMRQEYEMEEARRRELKIQRMRQAEEFQRRQEELRLQEELEREMQARRRLEKRLADLEAGLNSHNRLHSHSPRRLESSLPVPALRAAAPNHIEAALPSPVQCTSPRRLESSFPVPAVQSAHSPKDTVLPSPQPAVPYASLPVEQNPVTFSYHRPPTEILRAAGFKSDIESAKSCPAVCPSSNSINNLEINNSNTLSAPETGKGSSKLPLRNSTSNIGRSVPVNLDDSLPIPVLRAPSPVIPASRRKSSKESSKAMRKLEAKWEVPAVEKNIVFGSNPNNILTQLGAVRHRMQLEQQRMEQYLKQKS